MITLNLGRAKEFLTGTELGDAREKADNAFQKVRKRNGPGAEWLGWRDLLSDPNDAILEQLDSLAVSIRKDADVFIVCGIGGSYLGARAVIDALTSFFGNDGPEILYAGNHMSGQYLEELLTYLDKLNEEGEAKSVYCNVISKSGTTLETALSFRFIRNWMSEKYPDDLENRIICTTSDEGGALNVLVDEYGFQKFIIPEDVGGRFSVLTPVGLLPIAVAGIDIRSLFYGAVSRFEALEKDPESVINYAAVKYALYQKGKTIDVIASFEPQLEGLGRWLQQLLGESEGKNHQGMFPSVATYSTDLHSLGQFMQDGSRSVMETVISVEDSISSLKVKEMEDNHDELNYLSGQTFHDINRGALEGTIQAHVSGGVPTVVVHLDKLNAQHIGEFIYFYELFTAVYCYCLDVNPFNQPGVEDYKREMYQLLGKNK